uniref:Glycoside hydrolase family 125 protein n=1 Tax=Roseihalotalea indica TaxID=2867963 RepID=A0AA49GQJ6_9BACT|nr:glycoside hydrolase family 125 protein [Tunicatimonas sp. TK19036]
MNRRTFMQHSALFGAGALVRPFSVARTKDFPEVRVPASERNFQSKAIEAAIQEFNKNVDDEELGWLFNNCFPNTLDTTVTFTTENGQPDTYIITGDIDAMWLRDSTAQVWPYMEFIGEDDQLKQLIAGVINRQTQYILKDPYANAFYDDPEKRGEWSSDGTDMKPGVHERKWEIDSLCYPIRLSYHYWKATGDTTPFNDQWKQAIQSVLRVFRDQQKKDDRGAYEFQRTTPRGTDTQPMMGHGYPVNPVGLICSAFRPSDDATVFQFLIPSNFFAVVSLKQAAEMMEALNGDQGIVEDLTSLSEEVAQAIQDYAIVEHPEHGQIYAYEIDGFGARLLMDDANIPSLLSLPYLGAVAASDEIYQNTRNFVWSTDNPFFFRGKAAEGIGGPHIGVDMVWPMSITMRGLTSTDTKEIKACVQALKATHGDTGFMHESFHKDDPKNFTRSWFAWANTLFGEFLWKTYQEHPELLT